MTTTNKLETICGAHGWEIEGIRANGPNWSTTIDVDHGPHLDSRLYQYQDVTTDLETDAYGVDWRHLSDDEMAETIEWLEGRHRAKCEYWNSPSKVRDSVDLSQWPDEDDGRWLREALDQAVAN